MASKLFGLEKGSERIIFIVDDPRFAPKVVVAYPSGGTRRMPVKQARSEFRRLLDAGYARMDVCPTK